PIATDKEPSGSTNAATVAAKGPLVLAGHTGSITCLAYAPSGGQLATASMDATIRIWDTTSCRQIAMWPVQEIPSSLAYRQDGEVLAWSDAETYGFTMRALRGDPLATGRSHLHSGAVMKLRFLEQGRVLSGSSDGTLKLWRANPGSAPAEEDAVAR